MLFKSTDSNELVKFTNSQTGGKHVLLGGLFMPSIDRTAEEGQEMGRQREVESHAGKGHWRNQTRAACNTDYSLFTVCVAPALPTKLNNTAHMFFRSCNHSHKVS